MLKIFRTFFLCGINVALSVSHDLSAQTTSPQSVSPQDVSQAGQSPLTPPSFDGGPAAVGPKANPALAVENAASPASAIVVASFSAGATRLTPSPVEGRLAVPTTPVPADVAQAVIDGNDSAPTLKSFSDFLQPATTSVADQPTVTSAALSKSAIWSLLILGVSVLFMFVTGRGRA